jgi:hypothetical protein
LSVAEKAFSIEPAEIQPEVGLIYLEARTFYWIDLSTGWIMDIIHSPCFHSRLPLLGTISLKILTDAPISIAIGFAHLIAF